MHLQSAKHIFVATVLICLARGIESTYSDSSACNLDGIVSGGGEGLLDLDKISVHLGDTEPFDLSLNPIPVTAACSSGVETPISMRGLLAIDTAAWSISEMFHPSETALDVFGDKTKSDARRRCQPAEDDDDSQFLFTLHLRVAILYSVVYGGITYMPFCLDALTVEMEALDLPIDLVLADDVATNTPWGLAKAYVDETFDFLLQNDGWNADGKQDREFYPVPFSDYAITDDEGNSWEPYQPKNSPWEFKHKTSWQPLMEDDGLGYITTQEHVTPHLGATARLFGFESSEDEEVFISGELSDPKYKYKDAALDVLEETRLTAGNVSRLSAISFFDNKFSSLVPLKIAFFLRDPERWTALSFYRVTIAVQLSVYNGVVLSWREKVRHDLPRPPTIIKSKFGDRTFESYAGEGLEAQEIKASEWQPVIRTMPHSEYPSASSCLCQLYADQLVLFTGSDAIEPPLDFPISENYTATYASWQEIADTCAQSRLWGGLHFKEAVSAGAELCGGGGAAASIMSSIDRLTDGDESAAIFKSDLGELSVRPY